MAKRPSELLIFHKLTKFIPIGTLNLTVMGIRVDDLQWCQPYKSPTFRKESHQVHVVVFGL